MKADLKSKGQMREQELSFFSPKVDVFIADVGCKAGNFNVQPSNNLFLGMFEFKGLVNCEASSGCRPGFPSNILTGIAEEIKV